MKLYNSLALLTERLHTLLIMPFILYSLCALNLMLGAISYTNHDIPGAKHALVFGAVAVVGLVSIRMQRGSL